MEKHTMFMDSKNQYSEDEYTTQSNLQIQCNPYQAAAAKSFQSCPTLHDPIDGSPPGSSVHGIFQARVGCHCLLQLFTQSLIEFTI